MKAIQHKTDPTISISRSNRPDFLSKSVKVEISSLIMEKKNQQA